MNKTTPALCKTSILALLVVAACGSDDIDYVGIESITPDHGSQLGGNIVTVEGHGFAAIGAGLSNMVIGNDLALDVRVVSDVKAFVTMPPSNTAGPVDVELFNSNGRMILGEGYSYNPQPTVTASSPGTGPVAGGTEVTLTGTGFLDLEAGDNLVDFGDVPATVLSVESDTSMTVESPPGAPPLLNQIKVTNANGTGAYENAFGYERPANGLFTYSHGLRPGYTLTQTDPTAGAMLFVDLETQTTTTAIPAPTEGPFNGVGTAASDGTNIYLKTIGRDLIKLNPITGARENLGQIDLSCAQSRLTSLVFHQGISYAYCRRNEATSHFGRFDVDTGVFTPIGINISGSGDRTSLASDGTTLYAIGRPFNNDHGIYEINPVTGSIAADPIPIALNSIRGAAFLNGKLYVLNQAFAGGGSQTRPAYLFELDPSTGGHTLIMNMGSNLHGLTSGL